MTIDKLLLKRFQRTENDLLKQNYTLVKSIDVGEKYRLYERGGHRLLYDVEKNRVRMITNLNALSGLYVEDK